MQTNQNRAVAVLIPARGGSEGVRRKNLRKVGGQSLVQIAVRTALTSAIGDVWVSTDDAEISAEAERWGARVHARSAASSTSAASTEEVMSEFWKERPEVELLVLMQATCPFTRPSDLRSAMLLMRSGADSVVAVERLRRFRWRVDGEDARPTNYDPAARPRRQDWDGELYETGAFYMTEREAFLRTNTRVGGRVALYEVPAERSIDIDTECDLAVADGLSQRLV